MNSVLVTGATGAIGSALVPLFLRETDSVLHLVVRAADDAALTERLETLFRFWEIPPNDDATRRRVRAHRGDVRRPNFGLPDKTADGLAREVSLVVHSAGDVNFSRPLSEARASAVDSLHHVVAFARACAERGRLRKLDYVSTVGVAGRTHGLVPETPLTAPRGFHNTYEQAKAEAEEWLLGEMKRGFPATIHRPSMVVGDSRTGKVIHFQVFYHLCEFLSGRRTNGVVPKTGAFRLDVVPADYVARALFVSATRDDSVGRIFHLCSGPEQAPLLSELTEKIRAFFRQQGVAVPNLRTYAPKTLLLLVRLISFVVSAKTRKMLRTLPYFLTYLAEAQTFDNRESRKYFDAAGVRLPPVDDYWETILKYYLEHQCAAHS